MNKKSKLNLIYQDFGIFLAGIHRYIIYKEKDYGSKIFTESQRRYHI